MTQKRANFQHEIAWPMLKKHLLSGSKLHFHEPTFEILVFIHNFKELPFLSNI